MWYLLSFLEFTFLTDRPNNEDRLIKREVEVARQIMDRRRGTPLFLLNKVLNDEAVDENGYLMVDPENAKKDVDLTSLPEVQQLLLKERKRMIWDLKQEREKARSSNEGKSMYYNHILGDLGKRRK